MLIPPIYGDESVRLGENLEFWSKGVGTEGGNSPREMEKKLKLGNGKFPARTLLEAYS